MLKINKTCKNCGVLIIVKFKRLCESCVILRKQEVNEYKHNWFKSNYNPEIEKIKRQQPEQKQRIKEYNAKYRLTGKKRINDRKSYLRHIEKRRAACKLYRETKLDYAKQYQKNKNNLFWRLGNNLRNRLKRAIKNGAKKGSAVSDLGCSIEELKLHLENQFQPGMTWENWTRTGWHIDHIIPLAAFDLTDIEQLRQATHYTNLRPLWATENLIKKDKIIKQPH